MRRFWLWFTTAFLIYGCTIRSCGGGRQDIPPEDQLYSYIKQAVNVVSFEQREGLIALTTGGLRSALVNADKKTFENAYIKRKYDFQKFEILKKEGDKEKTTLDFKLAYKTWLAGEQEERAPLIETENRATLLYVHGQWALAEVSSLSTSFEWSVGLPLDKVSGAGVDPTAAPKEIESSRQTLEDVAKEIASPPQGVEGN